MNIDRNKVHSLAKASHVGEARRGEALRRAIALDPDTVAMLR